MSEPSVIGGEREKSLAVSPSALTSCGTRAKEPSAENCLVFPGSIKCSEILAVDTTFVDPVLEAANQDAIFARLVNRAIHSGEIHGSLGPRKTLEDLRVKIRNLASKEELTQSPLAKLFTQTSPISSSGDEERFKRQALDAGYFFNTAYSTRLGDFLIPLAGTQPFCREDVTGLVKYFTPNQIASLAPAYIINAPDSLSWGRHDHGIVMVNVGRVRDSFGVLKQTFPETPEWQRLTVDDAIRSVTNNEGASAILLRDYGFPGDKPFIGGDVKQQKLFVGRPFTAEEIGELISSCASISANRVHLAFMLKLALQNFEITTTGTLKLSHEVEERDYGPIVVVLIRALESQLTPKGKSMRSFILKGIAAAKEDNATGNQGSQKALSAVVKEILSSLSESEVTSIQQSFENQCSLLLDDIKKAKTADK